MKKLLVVSSALLCAAALFTGCRCKRGDAPADTFTVGFDAEFPPYGYLDEASGEYKGFDLDLAREVCARTGKTFVAKPINWDAKDMELNSGAIDCIWNGFTMQGREAGYTWTDAYVDNSQVVMVKAGSAIQTLADLAGKNVAVQTDTPVQKALSEGGSKAELGATFQRLVVTPNYNNAVMELDSGAVDAVAVDIGVAKQKMADMEGKFVMLDEIVMTETYGIGFKLGNTGLRDLVWATYQDMLADGTVDKLAEQYGIDGVIH
ncbi:MAG: transporter substrate-binding domain-containing protein [Kiritimatiellia bacterium]|jgi:polar amino acid transport system substrate-binding protein